MKENITSVRKGTLATGVEFSPARTNIHREAHVVIQTESVVLAAGLVAIATPVLSELRLETNLNRFASYLGAMPTSFLQTRPLALDQAIFEQQHRA